MNNDNTTPKPADSEQPSPEGLDDAACSPSYKCYDGGTCGLGGYCEDCHHASDSTTPPFDANFVWNVLRDAERGLNRCGIYANIELGGVCREVQKAQELMRNGSFKKARQMCKDYYKENANVDARIPAPSKPKSITD